MEDKLLVRKLENMDKELHIIMSLLKLKKQRDSPSLEEIRELFDDIESYEDPTELVREMRDKEYDL